MSNRTLNKNQYRTRETRQRLLDAAEEIFVRNGYEGAQLAEIASAADRSKGALYGHFETKEDLFLALFEYRSLQNIDRFTKRIEGLANRRQRMEAFRDLYVELVKDRTWPILMLEFKLYAHRHPESKERLRKAMRISAPIDNDEAFEHMHGSVSAKQRADIKLSVLALAPILSGLMLDSSFEPERMSKKALGRLLGKLFDALLPMSR
jgi:AcrR family transcriptional regulator